jgi:N-dimethylarginine dimethylaminohydrolase
MYQNCKIWDRLQTCVVGRTWQPEFYKRISNAQVRNTMERVAVETEEDLQNLIKCLSAFNVDVIRPSVIDVDTIQGFPQAPMLARDHLVMINTQLVTLSTSLHNTEHYYQNVIDHVVAQGNSVESTDIASICGAMVYQLGDRVFFSQWEHQKTTSHLTKEFLISRCATDNVYQLHQYGHIDGWFSPVTPGLIIAVNDPARPEIMTLFFKTYFSDWEVIFLNPSLEQNVSFNQWHKKTNTTWWLPDSNSHDVVELIDTYFKNWLGDVSETVFEVNMLVIDEKNVITSYYNPVVFAALERYGVTPHLVNLRHHMFWDGGVHCVTADLNRTN